MKKLVNMMEGTHPSANQYHSQYTVAMRMAHCMHHEEVFRTVTSQRHRTSRRKQCVMDSDANQRRNDGLRTVHNDNGVEEDRAVFVAIEEVFCTKDTTTTDDTNHIRRRLSLSN
eukprot:212469_1